MEKKIDFDQIVDRSGTHSLKCDELPAHTAEGAIPLWVADMDFPCAPPILDALRKRVDRQIFGYTIYNNEELKLAVTNWMARRFQWKIDPAEIVYSPGIVTALSFLIELLSNIGDSIVIQPPVYYPFERKILNSGRSVERNPLICQNGFYKMDLDDLEQKMARPDVRGMILCSPHNPVGRVWTQDELRQVVNICKRYDKWIISDEIHCDLIRTGHRHTPLLKLCPEYAHRIIACTSPSKSFNLAGLQLSNIVIPDPSYRASWQRTVVDRFGVGRPNPLSMTACIAAYEQCEGWLDQVNAYIDGNLSFLSSFLSARMDKACVTPAEGTYLAWIDLSRYCSDPKQLEALMLQKAGVVLDEGYIFGKEGEGFERINAACPRSVLADCLSRIALALGT